MPFVLAPGGREGFDNQNVSGRECPQPQRAGEKAQPLHRTNMDRSKRLGEGSIPRLLLTFSAPAIVGMMEFFEIWNRDRFLQRFTPTDDTILELEEELARLAEKQGI